MRLVRLLPAAALLLSASFAIAQTAPAPTNPLRPGTGRTTAPTAQTAPAQTTAPAATTTAPAPKADAATKKRERSEAQKANDNRMKACGAEWRANKEALTKQGKTWRTYMPECNARLKAKGQ